MQVAEGSFTSLDCCSASDSSFQGQARDLIKTQPCFAWIRLVLAHLKPEPRRTGSLLKFRLLPEFFSPCTSWQQDQMLAELQLEWDVDLAFVAKQIVGMFLTTELIIYSQGGHTNSEVMPLQRYLV